MLLSTDPQAQLLMLLTIALAIVLGVVTHWAGVSRGFALVLP